MKDVINNTGEEVAAYFDGKGIYFKAGQKKQFEDGVADEIVRETEGLVFEKDLVKVEEVVEKKVEKPMPKIVDAKPKAKGKPKVESDVAPEDKK